MVNTFGLFAINNHTFNVNEYSPNYYPKELRDPLVTGLKVHNLILNILGYIPGVSLVSGCVRMGTGLMMCVITLAVGERDAKSGLIIGNWYDEAINTGISQIARGAIEAFVSFGQIINASLDFVATFFNVLSWGPLLAPYIEDGCHAPHSNPKYPWLLTPLDFV